MRASKQFVGGKFQNAEPTSVMAPSHYWGAFKRWLFGKEMRVPSCPLPLVTDTAARLARAGGLRAARHLARTLEHAHRDRRRAHPDRSDVGRARVAVALGRPEPHAPAAAGAGRSAADRRRRHLARALRPPRHGDDRGARRARRHLPRPARRRRAPRGLGDSGRADRRARLVAGGDDRRRRADRVDAGAPLQRARDPLAGRRALDLVVDRRAASPAVLQRRHRPHRRDSPRWRGARGRSTSRCWRSASITRAGGRFTSGPSARSKRSRASAPRR